MPFSIASLSPDSSPEELLEAILDVSLTGINLLRPLYGPSGELEDFVLEYLNPAAQRMAGLAERPGGTLCSHFPHTRSSGVLDFYRQVFQTGRPDQRGFNYQADGLDNYFRLAARRSGERLVVSLTDTSDQDRSAVEMALRQSQAAEKAARAEAETERQRLHQVLLQLPAQVAVYRGPDHVYELVNPRYQSYFPARPLLGLSIREALPEIGEQGFFDLLDQVYRSGEPFARQEVEIWVDRTHTGRLEQVFNNVLFHPLLDSAGRVTGIIDFTYDVTEQVRARRQVEGLNQELETRVQQRTGELEQARAAAETQGQRLERLFQQAPAAICILAGPDLVFELANPAYQRFFPGRQLLGKPLTAAVPELADHPAYHIMQQVYQTGITNWQESLHAPLARPDDGLLEDRYFTYVQQPRYDEQDLVNGVLIFGFEVTDQVQSRRKVEESAQQVRALVEGAPFPIGVYVGPEFRIELANQAMVEGLGKGPGVIGKRFAELMPELENQAVIGQLNQVLSTGRPLHRRNQPLEVVMDGVSQTFYYNYSLTPLRDAQGEVYGILNTAADVTDLVQARRRTEEAAAELRMLTAHAPAFLFRTDPAGRIVYMNEAFFEWTGLDRTRLAGFQQAWDPVHPEDRPTLEPQFEAAIGGTHSWESPVYRLCRHDGQYRWAFSRTQPVLGNDGRLIGHNGLTLEIHDQVELQRQLQRTNADLDNFIYTASHDLKAPILNIEGLLKVLSRKVDPSRKEDETLRQIFAMMESSVGRFKATIMDLTDIARIGKQLEAEHEPVNLQEIVSDILLDLERQINEAGAVIEQGLEACATIQFPRKNLKSVIYNLLSNAIKYRSPGRTPRVTLTCHEQADYQVLSVQDNGLGLDTGNPEKIFGMFKRQHAHVEGTGVGLYIVKKMIENAGGKIEVESQVGQGSTFRVYFKQ